MNDLLSQIFSAGFIFIVIRVGTPLVYASMSSYIGNLAGISNIALGLFLIMIFVSFLRGNKEHNETASLAQVNFADISQSRIFINNKSCNLYFYFVLSINFLL